LIKHQSTASTELLIAVVHRRTVLISGLNNKNEHVAAVLVVAPSLFYSSNSKTR
jgi:hypothetical protein